MIENGMLVNQTAAIGAQSSSIDMEKLHRMLREEK